MPAESEQIIVRETIGGRPAPSGGQNPKVSSKPRTASRTREKAAPFKGKADPYIWGIYLVLLVVSVIELFSASSSEIKGDNIYGPLIRHGIFLLLGLGIVLSLQKLHYGYFSRFAWFFAVISFVLLIISSFFGAEINGAQRAIKFAGITIQPPEIVKLTVVLLLATILSRTQRPGGVSTSGVIQVSLVVVIFSAVLWINGLTNMILLMGISVSMFLIGGIQWRKLGIVFLIYSVCGGALFALKYTNKESSEFDRAVAASTTGGVAGGTQEIGRAKTHKGRFANYINGVHPNDTVTDDNRQVFFANMAQAHGGLIGKGPGNSRESARLPLAFSDYIYSIIVEDAGFVGGVALLVIYLLLLGRAGKIAYRCKRAFPAFMIMGCAVMIVFQALVHMCIVTGIFPVSGQPLPLISKGGTSVLVMSAAIGIMLSVSRFAVNGDTKETKADLNSLPEDLHAVNASQMLPR